MSALAKKARPVELIEPTVQRLAAGLADVDELGRKRWFAARCLLELREHVHARQRERQT